MAKLTTSDFVIGDAVKHYKQDIRGVVTFHDHGRGLIRVRWESRMEEWVPPKELLLLAAR